MPRLVRVADRSASNRRRRATRTGWIVLIVLLPVPLQALGSHWVRIADTCLLYVLLALGMNVVVGMAGLLDLGFVAFYALGAYATALLASPHLTEHFGMVAAMVPGGLHAPWWISLCVGAALAATAGVVIGAPTLRLRGDYLAIVTLGFGEIVRLLLVNLGQPVNFTNGAKGIGPIDAIDLFGLDLGTALSIGGLRIESVTLHFYLFLAVVGLAVLASRRLQDSRIGRAWNAIRDDEVAAQAMGIDTHALKLLAFATGASFGGVAGSLFGGLQVFVSPEAFSLQESVIVVAMVVFGGIGHIRGVALGAVLLTALPEVLREVTGPLQAMTDGRLDAGVLRPLLVSLAMIGAMLLRPHGLLPSPSGGVGASALDVVPADRP